MAQFYTLEEAARVLGMSTDELKAKAQHREVRAFMDSGSWRFRVADIDELARRRGMGSDPDLSLSDLELAKQGEESSDAEMILSEYQLGVTNPDLEPPGAQGQSAVQDDDIRVDDTTLPPPAVASSSSTIIGMGRSDKLPSDSDVRLIPDNASGSSDSDVRLAPDQPSAPHGPTDSDVTLVSDDENPIPGSSDDFPVASPSDTSVGKSPLLGSSAEVPSVPGAHVEDSDFELTPSSVIDALQPESGSDFELTALDASDEFEATPLSSPSDSDVTAAEPSASGINLGRPSDSGINLQGFSGVNLGASDSIELAPLEDEPASAPAARPAPKAAAKSPADTDVPAQRKPEKDIFEDTDFEVDALDTENQDQTIQLEVGSDYDLEDDADSGSEVFAVDEEDVDQNAATSLAPGLLDEEEEDFAAGSEESSAWDVESEADEDAPAGVASPAAVLAPAGAGAEWSGPWVITLGFATFFVALLAFASMDLVRNMYDYRGPVPIASGLVRLIAETFGS